MAEKLIYDSEDLNLKAVGWMLKEACRIDSKHTLEFISAYQLAMPRTMLHYSIREHPNELKKVTGKTVVGKFTQKESPSRKRGCREKGLHIMKYVHEMYIRKLVQSFFYFIF